MVDTRGERRTIGAPASEGDGVAWIRGFKEGETQLRILESATDWWKYPEHYDPTLKFFACNSATRDPDPENCIGCAHPSERTQSRSFKYAFNAIDKDGRVRVFKLGGKIRKTLRQREQTLGRDILARRDIVIIRTGTGFGGENGTEYSYEWGEEYEPEVEGGIQSFIDQANDIGEAVTESYWEAVRKLEEGDDENADDVADHSEGDDEPDDANAESEPAPRPAKKTAAAKAAPAKKAAPAAKKAAAPAKATRGRLGAAKPAEDEPDPNAVEDVTPDEPGPDGDTGEALAVDEEVVAAVMDKLRDYETDDVRQMLRDNGVEFPERAPRPRIMAIAEQGIIDGKLPPF